METGSRHTSPVAWMARCVVPVAFVELLQPPHAAHGKLRKTEITRSGHPPVGMPHCSTAALSKVPELCRSSRSTIWLVTPLSRFVATAVRSFCVNVAYSLATVSGILHCRSVAFGNHSPCICSIRSAARKISAGVCFSPFAYSGRVLGSPVCAHVVSSRWKAFRTSFRSSSFSCGTRLLLGGAAPT